MANSLGGVQTELVSGKTLIFQRHNFVKTSGQNGNGNDICVWNLS